MYIDYIHTLITDIHELHTYINYIHTVHYINNINYINTLITYITLHYIMWRDLTSRDVMWSDVTLHYIHKYVYIYYSYILYIFMCSTYKWCSWCRDRYRAKQRLATRHVTLPLSLPFRSPWTISDPSHLRCQCAQNFGLVHFREWTS